MNPDLLWAAGSIVLAAVPAWALYKGLRTGRMPARYEEWDADRSAHPFRFWALAIFYTLTIGAFVAMAAEFGRRGVV